jgi:hypothetical protein
MHLTFSPSRPSISFATLQPSLTPPNTNTNSPVKQASLQRQGFTVEQLRLSSEKLVEVINPNDLRTLTRLRNEVEANLFFLSPYFRSKLTQLLQETRQGQERKQNIWTIFWNSFTTIFEGLDFPNSNVTNPNYVKNQVKTVFESLEEAKFPLLSEEELNQLHSCWTKLLGNINKKIDKINSDAST